MAPWWWSLWGRDGGDAVRMFKTRRADAVLERLDALSDELRDSVQQLGQIAERLETDGGNDVS